jgi:hypothetical protein
VEYFDDVVVGHDFAHSIDKRVNFEEVKEVTRAIKVHLMRKG